MVAPPYHAKGNYQQPVFDEEGDSLQYLQWLKEIERTYLALEKVMDFDREEIRLANLLQIDISKLPTGY